MARGGPEVADVFRRYGEAYRQRHGASLSTAQRRVMTAIELCRTAALGGHIEKCDHCDHQRICYDSCIMGKFGNGESDRINSDAIELSSNFHSPLRVLPQQSDK
jgi:Transposase zinc-binding domain